MLLNVISLVMVLAITFLHSTFGFFSGLINVVCSILSAVIAFGFSEKLNEFVTGSFGLHPAYSGPCCLVGLFLVSMIILRTLADNYVRGNVRIPSGIDMAGAGICGFVNAQIFVGVVLVGVLMLPARSSEKSTVLGFTRWERSPDERDPDHADLAAFDRHTLWTRSDEFVVGLFKIISGGSLAGTTSFASVYPDFIDAVEFTSNTVQPESSPAAFRDKKNGDGFKNGLTVDAWWVETGEVEGRYRKEVPSASRSQPDYQRQTFKAAPDRKLIVTKLTLKKASADHDDRSLKQVFRPTMIRLVGRIEDGAVKRPEQYTPRILANADPKIEGQPRIVDYDNNFELPGGSDATIYAYFEVAPSFQPAFVEYRRYARAAVPAMSEEAPALELTLAPGGAAESSGSNSGKRTFGQVLEARSGDNSKLPFTFSQRALQRAGDVTLEGGQFVCGRFYGGKSRLERTGQEVGIEEIKLPPNKRLIQVRYQPKKVRSIVGQVFNYVGQLNQYLIEDTSANDFPMVGYYAITKRGDEEFIEMFYNRDPDDPMDPGYASMLDFKSLDRDEINDSDNTIVCLMFLVPPKTEFRAVKNQTGDGGEIRMKSFGP